MSVSSLTKNGIEKMLVSKEMNCIVQILDYQGMQNKNPNNAANVTEKYKVTISDGFAKNKVVFGNTAASLITTSKLKPNSVIKIIDLLLHNTTQTEKPMLIVMNFEIINQSVDEVIGEPIEYSQYKAQAGINKNGSTVIPAKYLKNSAPMGSTAPAGQNNSFSMNQLKTNLPITNNSGNSSIPNTNRPPNQASSSANTSSFNNQNQRANQAPQNKLPPSNKPGGISGKPAAIKMISEPNENFMPFSALTATSDGWRIKGRVIKKSDVRKWKSQKGEGTVFSIDLLDHCGNEIQGSFFNDSRFYDMLEEGNVYTFSGGSVKPSNSKWSKNEYQITFDERAIIDQTNDDGSILPQKFAFTKIEKIRDMAVGQSVDILAIVSHPGEATSTQLRSGETKLRRNVMLYDDSQFSVELTLWGETAKTHFEKDQIVAIRDVRINEFNNSRNLSGGFNTAILLNGQNLKEGVMLQNWKELNEIREEDLKPISDRGPAVVRKMRTLEKIEEDAAKLVTEKERIFNDVVFSIVYMKMDGVMFYLSCHNEKCFKKIQEYSSTGYHCDNCQHNSNEPPRPRFVFSAKIMDSTHAIWISIGDDAGKEILGHSAQEIKDMKDRGQDHEISEIGKEVYFKEFKGKIVSRLDSYNGNTSIKHSLSKVFPRDIKKEATELINEINEYLKL